VADAHLVRPEQSEDAQARLIGQSPEYRFKDIPDAVRLSMELWVGCVAGALDETTYRQKLNRAGFDGVDVEPTRIYRAEDAREFLNQAQLHDQGLAEQVDGLFMSAFIRAQKPAEPACCGPSCCH